MQSAFVAMRWASVGGALVAVLYVPAGMLIYTLGLDLRLFLIAPARVLVSIGLIGSFVTVVVSDERRQDGALHSTCLVVCILWFLFPFLFLVRGLP